MVFYCSSYTFYGHHLRKPPLAHSTLCLSCWISFLVFHPASSLLPVLSPPTFPEHSWGLDVMMLAFPASYRWPRSVCSLISNYILKEPELCIVGWPLAGGSQVLLGMEMGAESQDRPEESQSQKHFSGLCGAQQKGTLAWAPGLSAVSREGRTRGWRRELRTRRTLLCTYRSLPLYHSTN